MTLLTSAMLAAVFAAAMFGQSTNGYVFVAPGGVTGSARTEATLQVGIGAELALPKGFGAGVEVGAISPFRSWGDATLGTFAANGYYHFLHGRGRGIDPFATAGYTLFFATVTRIFSISAAERICGARVTWARVSSFGTRSPPTMARSTTGASASESLSVK